MVAYLPLLDSDDKRFDKVMDCTSNHAYLVFLIDILSVIYKLYKYLIVAN